MCKVLPPPGLSALALTAFLAAQNVVATKKHSVASKSSMTSLAAATNGVGSTAAAISQFDGCATGAEIFGRCYYYNEDSLSRDDAQTACEALGGMLA
ncbi:unnamed protein product, partial [Heterosigma akashiwo]